MPIDVRHTEIGDREIVLIGSEVVTNASLDEADVLLHELEPDVVVLDYDSTRWRWLEMLAGEGEVDLVQVIRAGEMSQLNARLALGVLAKYVAPRTGVPLDAEFVRAYATAQTLGAEVVFGRRPAEEESLRGWRRSSVGARVGFGWRLFTGSLRRTQLPPDEASQPFDAPAARAEGMRRAGEAAPVLFDEATAWLAAAVHAAGGERIVVVTHASNLDALEASLHAHPAVDGLDVVPAKTLLSRALPWIFSALIIAAFILGFVFADPAAMEQAMVAWFASNMTFAAIGALLALAHPVTIIATALSAPFVSLNPAVGAGMVGALVQAFVAPPTVRDMDRVGDDITRLRGWWQNRLARLVLIFVFANAFSSVGSFVALAWFPTGN